MDLQTAAARLPLHDGLTRLATRVLLRDRLDVALGGARRDGRLVGLMVADLDGFKVMNETLGREVGDAVLRAVAGALEAAVRPGDSVCRYGGDEFAVVCDGLAGVDEADRLAARLVAVAREQAHAVSGAPLTVSIGVALGDGATPRNLLLTAADASTRRAKAAGGDRFDIELVAGRGRDSAPAPGACAAADAS